MFNQTFLNTMYAYMNYKKIERKMAVVLVPNTRVYMYKTVRTSFKALVLGAKGYGARTRVLQLRFQR